MPSLSLVEYALAIRHNLVDQKIPHEPSTPNGRWRVEQIPAEVHAWLKKEANDLLAQHRGSTASAVQSLKLDAEVAHRLLKHADQESVANLGTTDRSEVAITATKAPLGESIQEGGRYELLEQCGQGGLGVVFAAQDQQLNRVVALKKLHPRLITSEAAMRRFRVEAEVTGELQHPAIAPVYSLDTGDDGTPFYTMRFIEGTSLDDKLKQRGTAPVDFSQPDFRSLLTMFTQVIRAVHFAHSRGVLHRDIKPANIMLGEYGETFLVDWGLAKVLGGRRPAVADEAGAEDSTLDFSGEGSLGHESLTHVGDVLGTPAYMAPEQAHGAIGSQSIATDVYGLGATLFGLLTGQSPFKGMTPTKALQQLKRGEIPTARYVNPRVPAALDAICGKAMASDQQDRYLNADELRQDLELWLADEPVSVAAESFADRLRRQVRKRFAVVAAISVGALACLLLIATGLAVSARRNRQLNDLNRQLVVATETANTSRARAELNFQRAQDVVGDFLVQVTDHPALKNGRADSRELKRDLLEKARSYYEQFLAETAVVSNTRPHLIDAHERLSLIYREIGRFEDCRDSCQNGLALLGEFPKTEANRGEIDDRAAAFLSRLGVSQSYLGNHEAARTSLEQSVSLREALVEDGLANPLIRRNLARSKSSLALTLLDLGSAKDADQHMKEAHEIAKSVKDPSTSRVADQVDFLQNSLNRAHTRSDLGDLEGAIELLREGAARAETLQELNPDRPEFKDIQAALTQDLAIDLWMMGQPDDAEILLTQAIGIRRELIESGIGDFENRLYLGTAIRHLAELEMEQGREDSALARADEAIEMLQRLLVDEDTNTDARDRLSSAFMTRAEIVSARGDVNEASKDFQRATGLLREMLQNGTEAPRIRQALARTLHNHANLLFDSHGTALATEKYREAAEIIEELATQPDPSISIQRDVVTILGNYGRLLGSRQVGPAGIEMLTRRVSLAKRLHDTTSLNSDGHRWALSMGKLAAVLTNRSQVDLACEWFRKSRAAWATLPVEYQKSDSFAQGLGGTLVNGSDALRLSGELDEALAWLDEAAAIMEPAATRSSPHPVVKRFYGNGKTSRAKVLMKQAYEILDTTPDEEGLVMLQSLAEQVKELCNGRSAPALELVAHVHLARGEIDPAIAALDAALEFATPIEQVTVRKRIRDLQAKRDAGTSSSPP